MTHKWAFKKKKKYHIVSTLTETELVEDDTKERDVIHIQDLYHKI